MAKPTARPGQSDHCVGSPDENILRCFAEIVEDAERRLKPQPKKRRRFRLLPTLPKLSLPDTEARRDTAHVREQLSLVASSMVDETDPAAT